MLANDPAYQEAFTHADFKLYMPVNLATGFHESRYVELTAQQIYAESGATKETLEVLANEMILLCNKELKSDTLRTDMALLANNILFRLKNPVDQHCAIRIGALMCFIELKDGTCEDPNKVEGFWQNKKEQLAFRIPELYTFFLTMGIEGTPIYNEVCSTLNVEDYLRNRERALMSLTPQKKNAEEK